jgi:hypothetical protein
LDHGVSRGDVVFISRKGAETLFGFTQRRRGAVFLTRIDADFYVFTTKGHEGFHKGALCFFAVTQLLRKGARRTAEVRKGFLFKYEKVV